QRGADGWRPGAPERTLGLRASETVGVELEGVSVDEGARLPAAGAEALARALEVDRLGAAAQAVGVARAAMEHAAEYALGRRQFDAPIASFGAIREKLGGMAQRTAAARALVAEAAAALQAEREGAEPGAGLLATAARTAMARLAASEAAVWAADEAIQVFGGYGYMRHYPVEKLLRDGKGMEIYGGTNDVMREIVAREVLRDAGAAAEETT
ncbi:MAG TPA: acyl-CoA dehydrogenase family protein, partial [Longimicrobiales bacterium]|nr:acyl-CoA dehydrogenase family protein [Longimicrobiales bacterium]